MNPGTAWVVGSGGLLGSSVNRFIRRSLPETVSWSPMRGFSWNDTGTIERELAAATDAYACAVVESGRPWMVLWCAGAGMVGTPADGMARETRILEAFLERLGTALAGRPGCFFLASSAGGVYGGSRETPLTEHSAPFPSSDYGRAKLRHEEMLAGWAAPHPGVSTLVGRISNLYGPAQNLAKPQGLIGHLSRCLLHHVPAHVFAPLDTLRDHLYAPDAAEQILRCMARLRSLPEPTHVTKIIASGQTTSIAGILAVFSHIAKRQPRIVCSADPLRRLQPMRLALRSTVWTDLPLPPETLLVTGIQAVYRYHLELFQAGRLPAPAPFGMFPSAPSVPRTSGDAGAAA